MWLNDSFEKVEPSSGVNRPNNGYHVSDKLKTAYAVRVHLWGRRDRPPVMWAEKAILQRVSLVLLVELWAAVCDETSSGACRVKVTDTLGASAEPEWVARRQVRGGGRRPQPPVQ